MRTGIGATGRVIRIGPEPEPKKPWWKVLFDLILQDLVLSGNYRGVIVVQNKVEARLDLALTLMETFAFSDPREREEVARHLRYLPGVILSRCPEMASLSERCQQLAQTLERDT